MAVGTCLGWTAPVGPILDDKDLKDSPLYRNPSNTESSWIGSLIAIGALISK